MNLTERHRELKITILQRGPVQEAYDETVQLNLEMIECSAKTNTPDLIVLPELSSTPYFCVVRNKKYFTWAEPIPGPYTDAVAKLAKRYSCYVLLPLFEKGRESGSYYNSAVVISPKGKIVEGTLPDGSKQHRYAKVHVPRIKTPTLDTDEKYYFKPGPGFTVFRLDKCKIGILICYDRRFPEAWRTLALHGAEVCFLPTNVPAWSPSEAATSEAMFIAELKTRALENLFYVVACNKAGYEEFENHKTLFFGKSCVIGATGDIVKEGPSIEPAELTTTIHLDDIKNARKALPIYKDRKIETYKTL
jgi:predicted amidohydrolase